MPSTVSYGYPSARIAQGFSGYHILALLFLYCLLLAITPAWVKSLPAAPRVAVQLTLAIPEVPPAQVVEEQTLIEHRVEFTETLTQVFRLSGLDTAQLLTLMDSPEVAQALGQVAEGDLVRIEPDGQGGFRSLSVDRGGLDQVRLERRRDGLYDISRQRRQAEQADEFKVFVRSPGTLLEDAARAGVSGEILAQISRLLGWSVDLALESRVGDQFTVLYKRLYLDGNPVAYGPVTALEWRGEDRVYRVFRYQVAGAGGYDYYAEDGGNIRKAFLRTPLKHAARISSPYGEGRKHPILHRIRAHSGVDYAAPIGTEVLATGRGIVTYARVARGYGNLITIDHSGGYQTRYGHLNHFRNGITVNTRIEQGDVIGYVGTTGASTGAHLHYEFRIDGQHTDPVSVSLPSTEGVPDEERDLFEVMVRQKTAQMEFLGSRRSRGK